MVIPDEVLAASGLEVGQVVVIRAEAGRIEILGGKPVDLEVAGFAARFMDRYRSDLARLADL